MKVILLSRKVGYYKDDFVNNKVTILLHCRMDGSSTIYPILRTVDKERITNKTEVEIITQNMIHDYFK